MKKIINNHKDKNEFWFEWLIRKINSYEAFKEFASGENPEDVAENFLFVNRIEIAELFEKIDEEDKDTLDQFQKLAECEWHVFRMLKSKLQSKSKVKFVDFRKGKKY